MKRKKLCFGIIILYILKIIVIGFYNLKGLDLIMLFVFLGLIFFDAYSSYKEISKSKGLKLYIFKILKISAILLLLLYMAINDYVTTLDKGKGYEKVDNLPWMLFNEFDEGQNSKVVSKTNVDNQEFPIPNEYINNEVIDGENVFVGVRAFGCTEGSLTYTNDNMIVINPYREECIENKNLIDLEFDDSESRYVAAVTTKGDFIYALSYVTGVDTTIHMLSIHDQSGKFIESHEYDLEIEFPVITFATLSSDDDLHFVMYDAFNINTAETRLMKIDKDFQLIELNSFEESRFEDVAVYDDYIMLITNIVVPNENNIMSHENPVQYEFIKLDLEGNILEQTPHIIPFTNYGSTVTEVDMNRDGKIYVIRYLESENNVFNQKSRSGYAALDIYNEDLIWEETIYFKNDKIGDYSTFFQVKEENGNYVIYSDIDRIEIEPHEKNQYGALIIMLGFLYLSIILMSKFDDMVCNRETV